MNTQPSHNILLLNASAQSKAQSITRKLANEVVNRVGGPGTSLARRELAEPLPAISETWIDAAYTPPESRGESQHRALELSDELIGELERSDILVIATPMYNFGVPASLKTWIDQVCRVGVTFRYTETGPKGLLRDRPVYLVVATGGTPVGSPADFVTGYLTQVLGFVGIHDINIIAADQSGADPQRAVTRALNQIEDIQGVEMLDTAA